jgi:hypothetical protein
MQMHPVTSCARGARHRRGVALVTVMAVLVVLALLAAMFATTMAVEQTAGQVELGKTESSLLANSALEHALAVLRMDAREQAAWDAQDEPWSLVFRPAPDQPDNSVDVDGLPGVTPDQPAADARWIAVRNRDGALLGRYAIMIEDEAGKINVNAAAALSDKQQNQGVGTFELLLTDGTEAGLPVSLLFGRNILAHRYGRDRQPGQAFVDDNLTLSTYASDLIDNDADGVVDESDEGIDEQEEYDPLHPLWDDRAFASVREAALVGLGEKKITDTIYKTMKRCATISTRVSDTYWDERNAVWRKQVSLNAASRKQINRVLRLANEEARFEPNSRNLLGLTGNICDYRDENHVLTTMGSEYGVEAVCFNEVMANDGSFTVRSDSNDPADTRYTYVNRFGWWYLRPDKISSEQTSWEIRTVGNLQNGGACTLDGKAVNMPYSVRLTLSDDPASGGTGSAYNDFKRFKRELGGWLPNMWRNGSLLVYAGTQNYRPTYRIFPIMDNTGDELIVGVNDGEDRAYLLSQLNPNPASNIYNRVRLDNLWVDSLGGLIGVFPRITDHFVFPTKVHKDFDPPKNLYYMVYVAEQNLDATIDGASKSFCNGKPWKGFSPRLDLDGDPQKYSETKMLEITQADLKNSTLQLPGGVDSAWLLRYPYKNGEPVRARNGYVHVTISTCDGCGYDGGTARVSDQKAFANKNVIQDCHFIRPDVVEMINISDHPISLRNWRVVINTGSYADQVGLIESATEFSALRRSQYDNPYPAIQPGGYFYLTNNRKIFDMDYGSPQDGEWGSTASEGYPCFELPDALWGVRYKVGRSDFGSGKVKCEGANWRRDQMKYEITEWHLRKPRPDQNAPFGLRNMVEGNTRDTLDFGQVNIRSLKTGDDILILGMPREGGFLSMTMKDEYAQICARTITYGTTRLQELGYSTEKLDPTHYTWVKNPRPTFGGVLRKARNHSLPGASAARAYVKDNRFVSVGELQQVRKSEDWENIGKERRGGRSTRTLKALARFLTTSGVRLDPEEVGAHVSGWRRAFGTARGSIAKSLTAEEANWEPGIWRNQTLRIMSGTLRGETYCIGNNAAATLSVDGFSIPSGKQLNVRSGDQFSVGPGYATPFFYTRQNNDEGIWEWKNKGIDKNVYGLYLYGLNDSISTTEFLEENHNAQLEVAVFNYVTGAFDPVPLKAGTSNTDDPYSYVDTTRYLQYEKSDGIYCGLVTPDHISAGGGIKLRIVAHGLSDKLCSGFAWFDYAYLAPGFSNGKLNINTASPRVLRSLPGVNATLADRIANGTSAADRNELKPYKNASDILDVRGMTPEIFSKIANLITTRSDQFRVRVVAQSVADINRDGILQDDRGERVTGETRMETVVDRHAITDDDPLRGLFYAIQGN